MMLTDSPAFAAGMMLLGLAAGMIWYGFRLKKNHLAAAAAPAAAVLGALLALICAKAGYLLHDLGASLLEGYFDEVTELRPDLLSFAAGCGGFIAGTALAARLCGIRPARALDLFAAPGCVFLCLARIAEAGMDTIGVGNDVEAEWMQFFPLVIRNDGGDAYLSVFVLEALTALLCLIPALRAGRDGEGEGQAFRRTAVWLLGAQIFWEMLLSYPYTRSFVTSFVSLEQVLCAVFLLAIVTAGCIRNRRWGPLPVFLALLGCSAFFQFFRDNKIEFVFEEGWEWALENAEAISLASFFLISAALIAVSLRAISGKTGRKAA